MLSLLVMLMKGNEERSHPLDYMGKERKGKREREKGITSEIMLRSTPLCSAMQEGHRSLQAFFVLRSRIVRCRFCCCASRFFFVPETMHGMIDDQ
jgi:hypothetical protein